MTFAAQSNAKGGKSQACHKFNKISNEKCYFKNQNERNRDKSNGKSGRAAVHPEYMFSMLCRNQKL